MLQSGSFPAAARRVMHFAEIKMRFQIKESKVLYSALVFGEIS
jgi:hypothetical protein